jgi:uncharacterized protein (TIGR03437 family)
MKCIYRGVLLLLSVFISQSFLSAQTTICVTSAVPPLVRAEGLTERVGDILYTCSGVPNTMFTGNFSVALTTNITNHISSGILLTGIVFTSDNGSGPQAVTTQPILTGPNSFVFNGVALMLSAQGTVTLRVAGIRSNATQVPIGAQIVASLAINGAGLPVTSAQLIVGTPIRGLYAGFSDRLICAQNGSPLPETITFASLIQRGTAFASTRVTEGFADSFGIHTAWANINADSGQRVIVRYSGFPNDARLFVPDVVAGSNAVQPTAGGDFGLPASGGAYMPSPGGSLLLARVDGAGSNGAGGTPVYMPGPVGSGTVAFTTVSELTVANGTAYVVYEVVDANQSVIESAQFPTFLGLLPDGNRNATQTAATVTFAPVSTVGFASATEPVTRFAAVVPPPDCTIVGDCAMVFPHLTVSGPTLNFSGQVGGATQQSYLLLRNSGGGHMPWIASITYASGTGWLSLDPTSGSDGANVRVYATPGNLAPGTYQATITIDASPNGGISTVQVTFTVTAVTPVSPKPTIVSTMNAASFAMTPAVPGSLTTVTGSGFAGKLVGATFDGFAAPILFSNDTQINLMVPMELSSTLSSKSSASLVVTVDGASSAVRLVYLTAFSPAIFAGGVLNQDYSANGPKSGAAPGSVIQIFATGLSGTGTITAHLHDRDIAVPYYAGPAPGLAGVQQVDLVVPLDLPAMTTEVYVCATAGDTKVCSTPVSLTIGK